MVDTLTDAEAYQYYASLSEPQARDKIKATPNLPPAGKPIVFRITEHTREDLVLLQQLVTRCSGFDKLLTISEVLRICISFARQHSTDLIKIGDTVMGRRGKPTWAEIMRERFKQQP